LAAAFPVLPLIKGALLGPNGIHWSVGSSGAFMVSGGS
jgi:hypothetical protein